MITFEQAQQLLGENIPNSLELLRVLDDCIKNNGEQWVKDHKDLLLAQWEYLDTM